MSTEAVNQLEAIREMMASGHRSVRMERHSLLLWGLASAFLILVTDAIFSPERFSSWWHQVVGSTVFIALALFLTGLADYVLTRRLRARRGETLSFVQRQLTKVWWLLVGLIVVLQLGMNFFGGGLMFYPLVLALLGLALYVHGLFSRQMLAWIGVVLIVLGLGSLVMQAPFLVQKHLAACVLGLGFPALALAMDRQALQVTFAHRLGFTTVWLALVLLATAGAYAVASQPVRANVPEVSLADYVAAPSAFPQVVVRLPAGTAVPVRVPLAGGLLKGEEASVVTELEEDIFVLLKNGQPTGTYRVADGRWRQVRESLVIRVTDISAELLPAEGPHVTMKTTVELR